MGDWVTMEADGRFSALLGKQTGSAYWSRRARVTSQATPFGTVILVWFLQGAHPKGRMWAQAVRLGTGPPETQGWEEGETGRGRGEG